MKRITINVAEDVYQEFQDHARRCDRTSSELIREAMELYRAQRIRGGRSLLDRKPLSVGKVLRPLTGRDDLLGEMLDG